MNERKESKGGILTPVMEEINNITNSKSRIYQKGLNYRCFCPDIFFVDRVRYFTL